MSAVASWPSITTRRLFEGAEEHTSCLIASGCERRCVCGVSLPSSWETPSLDVAVFTFPGGAEVTGTHGEMAGESKAGDGATANGVRVVQPGAAARSVEVLFNFTGLLAVAWAWVGWTESAKSKP